MIVRLTGDGCATRRLDTTELEQLESIITE